MERPPNAASWCTRGGRCFKSSSKEFGEWAIKIARYWTGKHGHREKFAKLYDKNTIESDGEIKW